MSVVLVHGNPETTAVWDLLVHRLVALGHDEPLRLAPPGFGAPVPSGWDATPEQYRSWLVAELEALGRPVDLVGHDWGGGHVLNVAMTRPDLLRSWCSDVVGIFDPDYVWHDLAEVWQRPGDGEEAIAAWTATPPSARAAGLAARGMDPAVAERVAAGLDDVMGACILRLYRAAAQPAMAELGAHLESAAARPGLAILPTEDHRVGTDEQRRRAAARAGARIEVLDGLGHWWMTEDPDRGAAVLARFWASLRPA
jgi:pimeloyl-ACP methyl ester carboxylesterase